MTALPISADAGTRARATRLGVVVALIVGIGTWIAIPTVHGEELSVSVDQVGWWTDRPAAPPAGEGAFEVASGVDAEPQSVAAFQVTIPATQVDTFGLTLVETAGFGSEFGSLAICRTEETWAPADPGELDDAPAAECSTKVYLTPVVEERTWIGDIAALVSEGGTVSLVVVPEYAPPAPVGPGMVVRIAEIQIAAQGSSAQSDETTTTLDFTTPGGSNQFDDAPDSGFTAGPDPIAVGPSPGSIDLGAAEPETPAPDTPPTSVVSDTGDDGFFSLEPEDAATADGRPWVRLLLLVPLSIGIGLGSARLRRLAEEGRLPLSPRVT